MRLYHSCRHEFFMMSYRAVRELLGLHKLRDRGKQTLVVRLNLISRWWFSDLTSPLTCYLLLYIRTVWETRSIAYVVHPLYGRIIDVITARNALFFAKCDSDNTCTYVCLPTQNQYLFKSFFEINGAHSLAAFMCWRCLGCIVNQTKICVVIKFNLTKLCNRRIFFT